MPTATAGRRAHPAAGPAVTPGRGRANPGPAALVVRAGGRGSRGSRARARAAAADADRRRGRAGVRVRRLPAGARPGLVPAAARRGPAGNDPRRLSPRTARSTQPAAADPGAAPGAGGRSGARPPSTTAGSPCTRAVRRTGWRPGLFSRSCRRTRSNPQERPVPAARRAFSEPRPARIPALASSRDRAARAGHRGRRRG